MIPLLLAFTLLAPPEPVIRIDGEPLTIDSAAVKTRTEGVLRQTVAEAEVGRLPVRLETIDAGELRLISLSCGGAQAHFIEVDWPGAERLSPVEFRLGAWRGEALGGIDWLSDAIPDGVRQRAFVPGGRRLLWLLAPTKAAVSQLVIGEEGWALAVEVGGAEQWLARRLGATVPFEFGDAYRLFGELTWLGDSPEVLGGPLFRGEQVLATDRVWPVRLDDGWRFQPDSYRAGERAGWAAPEFDDQGWPTLVAGKGWEQQGYPNLDGSAWYRRRIDLPLEITAAGGDLRFGGISDRARIFLDGRPVAEVAAAETPALVPLRPGLESVVVALLIEDTGGDGGLTGGVELWPVTPPARSRPLGSGSGGAIQSE